jgi:predicted transcriptional regulator
MRTTEPRPAILHVRVTDEILAGVQALADAQNRTQSFVAAELLEYALKIGHAKLRELANDVARQRQRLSERERLAAR